MKKMGCRFRMDRRKYTEIVPACVAAHILMPRLHTMPHVLPAVQMTASSSNGRLHGPSACGCTRP